MFASEDSKAEAVAKEASGDVGDLFDAAAILGAIDTIVPRYLQRTDRGDLIFPACQRKLSGAESDVRSIWAHTRLEAMRYITMVPARHNEFLVEPTGQGEMVRAFLRQRPRDYTVVDFIGIPADDLGTAITAGLNWLNHCALLAKVDRNKYSGALRNFRKLVVIAQQWWDMEGAEIRCGQMLQAKKRPPLMLYLVWQTYTRLAKEIASAAVFGPMIEQTVERRLKMLEVEFFGRPHELKTAVAELKDDVARFEAAAEPRDLEDQSGMMFPSAGASHAGLLP